MSTVAAVRAFNRFYTQRIGVLDDGLLHSRFSLPEVRVLWELAHRRVATATELRRDLGLDAGYLSRILSTLKAQQLLSRRAAPDDKRNQLLSLSARG